MYDTIKKNKLKSLDKNGTILLWCFFIEINI